MKKSDFNSQNRTKSIKKLSIIIPVYNEEKYISQVIDKVIDADSLQLKKEIILVNDGSSDKTKTIIDKKIAKLNKKINIFVIHQKKNQGKGAALKVGLQRSTGDIIIIQDADFEYSPQDYPLMLEPFIKLEADVIYGSRFISSRPHRVLYFWHFLGNLIITGLSNIMTNLNLSDIETGYKVFQGDLIRKIAPKIISHDFGFEPEITARIAKIKNLRIYEVGISYWGRTYNQGKKINFFDGLKAIWYILKYNLFAN